MVSDIGLFQPPPLRNWVHWRRSQRGDASVPGGRGGKKYMETEISYIHMIVMMIVMIVDVILHDIMNINPALQPNSIPESSTYVFFQTLCQSPVFSVPRKLFRTYSQIQDLAILGYQW